MVFSKFGVLKFPRQPSSWCVLHSISPWEKCTTLISPADLHSQNELFSMELPSCCTTAPLSRLALWRDCSQLFIQALVLHNTFSLLGLNCLEHFVAGQDKERTSWAASSQELMRPWQSLSPVKGKIVLTADHIWVRVFTACGLLHTEEEWRSILLWVKAIHLSLHFFLLSQDTHRERKRERGREVNNMATGVQDIERRRAGLWGGWRMRENGFSILVPIQYLTIGTDT